MTAVDAEAWQRLAIAGGMVIVAIIAARLVDRAITRRLRLPPEALTRYRVLRRSIMAGIIALGVLSALLVVPQVRAVAGGILASSAVVGVVLGLAAQSTLANFVAGMLIAFTQPLRLGDEIEVGEASGTVEEIALMYTTIRTAGGDRFYVPNAKLASDTIRNATIAGAEHLAEVTVPVPLASDLERVLAFAEEEARTITEPQERQPVASVTDFDRGARAAVVTVQAWAPPGRAADVAGEIRRAVHRRLRAEGLL
jgi:small conductance mechanosensitive channel